jgi:hypothetical protein
MRLWVERYEAGASDNTLVPGGALEAYQVTIAPLHRSAHHGARPPQKRAALRTAADKRDFLHCQRPRAAASRHDAGSSPSPAAAKPPSPCPDRVRCEIPLRQRIYEICSEFGPAVSARCRPAQEGGVASEPQEMALVAKNPRVRPKRRFVRTTESTLIWADHFPTYARASTAMVPIRYGSATSSTSGS